MFITETIDLLMPFFIEVVQVILGGPLTDEEPLMLPEKWERLKLGGVYTEIVIQNVNGTD